MSVVKISIESFEQVVISGSFQKPVAVCFEISPVFEKLSDTFKFTIAKLEQDDPNNQQIVEYLRLSAITDIRIFKDGQIAGAIKGDLPENELKAQVLPFFVSEDDSLLASAEDALNFGQATVAEKILQKLFAKKSNDKKIIYYLAKAQSLLGKKEEAKKLLQNFHEEDEFYKESLALLDVIDLGIEFTGNHHETLDKFLEIVESGNDKDGKAKKAMIALFSVLGPKHELTWAYRAKLNRAIYV